MQKFCRPWSLWWEPTHVNFFKISPQVDLCFLEGEKMTSVRDSMVFLDHAKFSAPLSLPTSSAPEKPSVDVEAREFKQFPRLKKGKVLNLDNL